MGVIVPKEARGGASVRTPSLGNVTHPFLVGAFSQLLEPLNRSADRQIPGRHDIGAAEREKEINLSSPPADAPDIGECGNRCGIVHSVQSSEIQRPVGDGSRQFTPITDFLATQPECPKFGIRRGGQARRVAPGGRVQAFDDRLGCMNRELLRHDNPQQTGEAPGLTPSARQSNRAIGRADVVIPACKFFERRDKGPVGAAIDHYRL